METTVCANANVTNNLYFIRGRFLETGQYNIEIYKEYLPSLAQWMTTFIFREPLYIHLHIKM